MKIMSVFCLVVVLLCAKGAGAAEYQVQAAESPPPDELAKPIAEMLSPSAIKVVKGEKRIVCEIWLCRQWPVKKDFEPTPQVLYPFESGQLIGVLRWPRKGNDFRDQPIEKGVYTLRYAQQPIDGSHVGTSPTRDFLVMVKAESDQDTKPIAPKELNKLSAAAAGSGHPAMLCLQRVENKPTASPALRHNADHDWWILQALGKGAAVEKPLPIDLIVVGTAAE